MPGWDWKEIEDGLLPWVVSVFTDVEQFQTTGFDQRIWELYLFATLVEANPAIARFWIDKVCLQHAATMAVRGADADNDASPCRHFGGRRLWRGAALGFGGLPLIPLGNRLVLLQRISARIGVTLARRRG